MTTAYAGESVSEGRAVKLGGLGGIAFVVGLFLQNAVLTRGGPLPDASVAEIADHYAGAGVGAKLAVALVAINMAALFLFASAFRTASRRSGVDVAGRCGVMGVVLLSATFSVTALLQSVLIATGDGLATEAGTTQLLWDMHTAALSLSQMALGVTLLAFSLATLGTEALAPRWASLLGIVGGALLLVGGAAPVAAVEGSKLFFVAFPGFFIWAVWLVTTSLRLLRAARS